VKLRDCADRDDGRVGPRPTDFFGGADFFDFRHRLDDRFPPNLSPERVQAKDRLPPREAIRGRRGHRLASILSRRSRAQRLG